MGHAERLRGFLEREQGPSRGDLAERAGLGSGQEFARIDRYGPSVELDQQRHIVNSWRVGPQSNSACLACQIAS